MEKGFESVDLKKNNNNITLSNNEKMYIIKIPKNFNIDELNDIKIKLSKKKDKNLIYSNDKVEIALEDVDAFNIMCPITSNKNTYKFAEKFDGAISINEVITQTNNNNDNNNIDDILEGLPIKLAYGKVKQKDGMGINFMPYGSTSLVSELEERKQVSKRNRDGISEKKSKKKRRETERN